MIAAAFLVLAPVSLYVSPQGRDTWSGRLYAPNARHTDGPLATITAARDVLRKLPPGTPARVEIRRGTYRITKPIVFGPEDSGSAAGDRVYSSGSGPALLTGMRRITGWKKQANGWLIAPVPAGWTFSQLFVNRQRRYRPRLPKNGYFTVADKVAPTEAAKGHGFDRFAFASGDIRREWAGSKDVELLAFHIWGMSRNRIKAVDPNVVTFVAPTGYDAGWADFPKGSRYLVENVREALSEPGEWYLDQDRHTVSYIPKAGETPANIDVEAPVTESLIEFRGDVRNRKWVRHVVVAQLQLEGGNWNLGSTGRNFPQAEADLPGAVRFEGARDCMLRGCWIERTGAYGVDIGPACKNVAVVMTMMSDLGAGGVKVGEMAWQKDPELLTEHCTVDGNGIFAGGRLHPAAVGVWVGQNPFIRVTDNRIRDLYYTGISVGWSWGYQPNGAHDNLIQNNRISDIGQGVLSDMGGIYTLGPQPGTVIRGNRIHDVQSYSYGGWGIYPDEGSTGILIENNCVFRTKSAGFHQHYGKENVIRNNVFAFGGEAQVMRTRAEDHLSLTFERNIVLFGDAPLLGSNWSGNNYKFDNNLYWRGGGKAFDFAGMTLDQWRAKGQDAHSVVADPLFRDPEHGDFHVRTGSPAVGMGFAPFPGLETDFDGGQPQKAPAAFPLLR